MSTDPEPSPANCATSCSLNHQRLYWIAFIIIALIGATLRIMPTAAFRTTGFDEILYRRYIHMLDGGQQTVPVFERNHNIRTYAMTLEGSGLSAMPEMTAFFLQTQNHKDGKPNNEIECELPPTRFLFIYTSWLWKKAQFGNAPPLAMHELSQVPDPDDRSKDPDHRDPALTSLHRVACLFSILLLIASGLFATRMLGKGAGLGVMALMACDPIQLHFSQHALIDGFFTFWAVMVMWTTWENLRQPNHKIWLIVHAVCLALLVLTKENSFFVFVALSGVVIANRWLKVGTVTRRFVIYSLVGPTVGFVTLVMLAGGLTEFIQVYMTLVNKAQNLVYAQLTGDGPWYRYLLDLMTFSPIVLCLALGGAFALIREQKAYLYLCGFVVLSYVIMCNVKYGMNLRYASIWELPMRVMAFAMVWKMAGFFQTRQAFVAVVMTLFICGYELRQYLIFATDPRIPLYELVPNQTLRLIKVIKDSPQS